MNFSTIDEQINAHRRIEAPTISETVSKQTLFGIICMLRILGNDALAPRPYSGIRNIKPIDCDNLYEFLNAVADKLECLAGLHKEGAAQ